MSDQEILDAEIVDEQEVDEGQDAVTAGSGTAGRMGPVGRVRQRAGQVRAAAADPDERARGYSWISEQTRLLVDGVRGRALKRREREQLAEYREGGNPDGPVREDLRAHYERTLDRRERAAGQSDEDWTAEDYLRLGGWGALGVGELAWTAELVGSLPPGILSAIVPVMWAGNLVAAPVLARWLAREGREYRAKLTAWELGGQPDVDAAAGEASTVSIDYLSTALADAGVLGSGEQIQLAEPVYFDSYGWSARIVLPGTKAASALLKAHERLTSALGASLRKQQVVLRPETARIVVLRVYATLPFTGAPVPHPLLGAGRAHSVARDGLPVGPDINGATITVNVADDLHGLVVAASGMGKTVHVRNLVVTVAHSSDAEVGGVFDGKASGDYDPVRTGLGWYLDTMESGRGWWSQLASRLEGEVAGAMARQQRIRAGETLGLRFVVLDEFQVGFGNPGDRRKIKDPETGESEWSPAARVVQACEELSRLGRSAGVRLILASQSFDGNVLPSAILNNVLWRLVGYVSSETMPPKDTVGAEGLEYGLVPDQTFTKAQKGAAICLSSSQDDGYALCRGWHQDPDEIRQDVTPDEDTSAAEVSASSDQDTDSQQSSSDEGRDTGQAQQGPALSADERALLETVVAVYGDDDAEWIPTQQLVREVAVGELDWATDASDRAVTMRVAKTLTGVGATKDRARNLPGEPMAWHRSGLVAAARTALAA